MKARHWIDSHKVATPIVLATALTLTNSWDSPTAVVRCVMHGMYSLMWCLKSAIYPDKSFEVEMSPVVGVLFVWGGLTGYWASAVLAMSRGGEVPAWLLGIAVALFSWGSLFHFAGDMQKHTHLKLKKGLITDGFFALSRNINYFGEFLIYGAFVMLDCKALATFWPAVYFTVYIALLWLPGMARKDASLARYPEFKAWKARTKLWIPYVW